MSINLSTFSLSQHFRNISNFLFQGIHFTFLPILSFILRRQLDPIFSFFQFSQSLTNISLIFRRWCKIISRHLYRRRILFFNRTRFTTATITTVVKKVSLKTIHCCSVVVLGLLFARVTALWRFICLTEWRHLCVVGFS